MPQYFFLKHSRWEHIPGYVIFRFLVWRRNFMVLLLKFNINIFTNFCPNKDSFPNALLKCVCWAVIASRGHSCICSKRLECAENSGLQPPEALRGMFSHPPQIFGISGALILKTMGDVTFFYPPPILNISLWPCDEFCFIINHSDQQIIIFFFCRI